jgi:hypothetical protein
MKKQIVSRDRYKVEVDQEKNRLYFSFYGDLARRSEFEHWQEDFDTQLNNVKPNFDVVVDFSQAGAILLPELLEIGMQRYKDGGVNRTAEVNPGKFLVEKNTERAANVMNYKKMDFKALDEADAWLNQ